MKKYFYCFVFFLFLFTHQSQAQVKFGIQAGVGFSKLTSPYYTLYNSSLCYSGGLVAILPLKNKISIVSGLQYESLQSKLINLVFENNGSIAEGEGAITTPYSYLKIPVLARLGLGQEENSKFYVEGGGFVSYLLNAKISGINKNTKAAVEYDADLSIYNKVVVGLSAGVGYQLTNNIDLGGRFNYNLTPVAPEGAKFINAQLLLSYYF
jgi:Outer membrane protein beta-barrel domain